MKKLQQYKAHTIPERHKRDKVEEVLSFLKENYNITISSVNSDYTSIRYRDESKGDKALRLAHIYLDMEGAGLTNYRTIIKDLISAGDILDSYNPILNYFDKLERWSGESHIEKLCSHIIARNFGDKDDEAYYQKRCLRIFRKWLVACVANYYGVKANDTILGIMSMNGGVGKTTLFQFLVPEELKEYYFETKKDISNYKFSLDNIFTSRMLNQFEELNGIKRSNINEFKQILSATHIEVKSTFGIERKARIANAAFTSNQVKEMGGFMYELMNDRRFAIIEIDNIMRDYKNVVDINQVWSEALVLYRSTDFDYVWGKDDYSDFIEYNKRYEKETESMKLLKLYYEVPDDFSDNKKTFMTAGNILEELMRNKKIGSGMNISDISIGRALNNLNYPKGSITGLNNYTIKGYYVVSRFGNNKKTG